MSKPLPLSLSIVIPALNEAANIVATLTPLQPIRVRGVEIVVVDGGSADNTIALATPLCDRVLTTAKGRALQMNAGASDTKGEVLLFLHADSILPSNADTTIQNAITNNKQWGRFDIHIEGTHPMFGVIAWFMNHRSRLTGINTGDQGMFMTREIFLQAGGFPAQPLMEDVELSSRLKRIAAPICLRQTITTSGRRWQKHGLWRTIFTMWRLRLAYFFGASPTTLHQQYYGH